MMEKKNIYNLLKDCRFIVSEIQREYVWGNNKPIVEVFINDLIKSLERGETNIGFLYSYQNGNEYYIIDGQQRFTTIILLLYSLSTVNDDQHNEFIRLLRLKDLLPAFTYRVRATTVSFMNHLFESGLTDINEIKRRKWFKLEYENDVTILALLKTLQIFSEMKVKDKLKFKDVLESVTFWYFAVEQTSQGEELYITMNSRGKKLSDNEQLKPRLFSKLDSGEKNKYGKMWDEWEEFFYCHRNECNKSRDIKSVDIAMNNVIRIALELITKDEHNNIKVSEDERCIGVADLEKYMNAIISLFNVNRSEFSNEIDRLYGDYETDKNFFVLKALIIEQMKGQEDLLEYERVYHTMKNQVLRSKITSHKAFLEFLSNYMSSSKDFYDFVIEEARFIKDDELDKIVICRSQGEKTERALWGVQETKFWKGDIRPMLHWANKDGKFSLDEFKRVQDNFSKFFNEEQEYGCTFDLVRRSFLCIGLNNYPIGGTNFGYARDEWINVFIENECEVKEFLCGLGIQESVENYCKGIIAGHKHPMEWEEFVEEPELLDYLNTKHLYWDDTIGYILVKNNWAQPLAVKCMHIFLVLKKSCYDILSETGEAGKWKIWAYRDWKHSCAVIDCPDFALDILYHRSEDAKQYYDIQLFKRSGGEDCEDTQNELASVAERFDFVFDTKIGRYSITKPFDDQEIITLVRNLHDYQVEYSYGEV